MRKGVIITILIVIFTRLTINHGERIENEKLLIHANNEFTSKFYKFGMEAMSNSSQNFIFCPLCLSTGMALLSMGASGETLSQIQNSMGFPQDESVLLEGYKDLTRTQIKANKLMFNGLFLTNNLTQIDSNYETKLKNYFQTVPKFVSSSSNENLKKEIERMLKHELEEIGDKLPEKDGFNQRVTVHKGRQSSTEESIVLINYLRFKAGWERRFETSSTTEEPFYVSNDEIIPIKMMRQTGHFNIVRIPQLNCRAIAIPYLICDGFNLFKKSSAKLTETSRSKPRRKKVCKSGVRDSRLQMIVLVPNEQGGLKNLESLLTPQSLLEIPQKFEYKTYLDFSLPKFSLDSTQDFVNLTSQFGMDAMSSATSNFSRISDSDSLRVSKIFHHVSLHVDEKGSRTKSSHLKGKNPWMHPKLVKVDQPFLAFIHDKKLNAILIVLKVVRPI